MNQPVAVPPLPELLGAAGHAWDTSPAMITVTWGPDHVLAYQNATSARVLGARELGLPLDVTVIPAAAAPTTSFLFMTGPLSTASSSAFRHRAPACLKRR